MMKRIFLIGYMGAGKTTVGVELAKMMNLEFVDLDHFIQGRFQKSVNKIFEESGEQEFRSIENRILHEVGEFENIVISTGGGTPCFFDNMDYMNSVGRTVYLKTSPEALFARLSINKDKRPLLRDKKDEELHAFIAENLMKREPFYSKAQVVFDNSDMVAKEDVVPYVQKLIECIK